MYTIKTLLLDFGNVLGTFRHLTACENIAMYCGDASAEDIYATMFARNEVTKRQTGQMTGLQVFAQVQELFDMNECVTYECFTELWGDIFTPAPESILRTLKQVRSDVCVCIASNTEELHWPYIEHLETVQRFINDPNRRIVKSYEVGYEKPDEDFFLATLDAIGATDPGHVLFIDDIKENVDAFKRMGGQGELFDLTKNHPDRLALVLKNYGVLV